MSTNDDVWSLAKQGAPEGAVVVASSQKQGRGQWGRAWMSPEGGLYFSLLLRPTLAQSEWPALSLAIARAICRTLRAECGVEPDAFTEEQAPPESGHGTNKMADSDLHTSKKAKAATTDISQDMDSWHTALTQGASAADMLALAQSIRVKHPNDVVCDAGKICGISLEAREGCVVVGCGVNVFPPSNPVKTDGRNEPAYLFDLAGSRLGVPSAEYLDALLDALLAAIDQQILPLLH